MTEPMTDVLALKVAPIQRATLHLAARYVGRPLSTFVRESALDEALRVLASQREEGGEDDE